jgi:hypothetical protein
MRSDRDIDRVRSIMTLGNPVPGDAYQDGRPDQLRPQAYERIVTPQAASAAGPERPERPRRARSWTDQGDAPRTWPRRYAPQTWPRRRLLAPAATVAAVLVVLAGVAIAGRAAAGRTAAGTPVAAGRGMPRYYVTISGYPPHAVAVVHASATGQALTSVKIPPGVGELPSVTAARDDRTFVIAAARSLPFDQDDTALYLLRVTARGHLAKFTRLPLRLTSPGTADVVEGIALSPGRGRLAVALEIPTVGFHPRGEIVVFSLRGGTTRTWKAGHDVALPWDPVWTGSHQVSFLWQDHIRGPVTNFTARTQVRVLDTSASGSDLLVSRVLATGGGRLGFIQTALAAPGGGPIIASAYRNVPATGVNGTATVRLVALSARTGKVIRVFLTRQVHYHGLTQLSAADASCLVQGLDASGQHALVSCPRFGRLDHGQLTQLPPGSGTSFGAAW